MGNGGEIFVLDMGEPIRIVDLAKDMIRLSGLPESAIEINFSGIRPGEKLFEELYFSDEESLPTPHPKLRASKHRPFEWDAVSAAIDLLSRCSEDDAKNKRLLADLVPEYAQSIYGMRSQQPANWQESSGSTSLVIP
jgi:FlaA1/EpsC-like NDP-sugar epimerase